MDKKQESCGCSPHRQVEKEPTKVLKIKWQRLISKGETCPRCGATENELEKAVSILKQSLAPLGIELILEKEELSVAEFKKDPLKSNRILINNRSLEDWLGGEVGHSPCCDVCGPSECRTVEVEGQVYETVPAEIIIKAGLSAASQLVVRRKGESCCGGM